MKHIRKHILPSGLLMNHTHTFNTYDKRHGRTVDDGCATDGIMIMNAIIIHTKEMDMGGGGERSFKGSSQSSFHTYSCENNR